MKWLTKNKNRIFIFFILILFVDFNLKAETEAERRASERRLQEIVDRDEKKTQQEADRVYDEKYGPGKTDYSYVPIYFILYPMVAFMIYLFLSWFIESWKEDYGWKITNYTDFSGGLDHLRKPLQQLQYMPIQQRVFIQNGRPDTRNHPNGIHGFNSLVIEYRNSSDILRKKEIEDIFQDKEWGVPCWKGKNMLKHSLDEIAVFPCSKPCPQCKGGIDSSNLKDGNLYTCPLCKKEMLFINDILENQGSLLTKYQSADADRKWEIYNIFKKQGWGQPY